MIYYYVECFSYAGGVQMKMSFMRIVVCRLCSIDDLKLLSEKYWRSIIGALFVFVSDLTGVVI